MTFAGNPAGPLSGPSPSGSWRRPGADEFDVEDALTLVLRRVAPALRSKPVGFAFDSRLAATRVFGHQQALEAALFRLIGAVAEVLGDGFLVVHATGSPVHQRLRCTVHVAATGRLLAGDVLDAVIRRLGLQGHDAIEESRLKRARGRCPTTGASIRLAGLADHQLLVTYEIRLPMALPHHLLADVDAGQARAWVIDDDESSGQMLARHLQRLGWATWQFRSTAQAMRRLQVMPPAQARPALVLGVESPDLRVETLGQLAIRLPPATRCVLGAPLGSETLCLDLVESPVDVQPWPFSHADLAALTRAAAIGADPASDETHPVPLLFSHRRTALIVDHDEASAIVLSALANSLGLEARRLEDGESPEQACLAGAPDVLLIDLSTPTIDGIATARHLRESQREGVIPPFAVIGVRAPVGAGEPVDWQAAGIDAVLDKPVSRESLRAQIRRTCGWPIET